LRAASEYTHIPVGGCAKLSVGAQGLALSRFVQIDKDVGNLSRTRLLFEIYLHELVVHGQKGRLRNPCRALNTVREEQVFGHGQLWATAIASRQP